MLAHEAWRSTRLVFLIGLAALLLAAAGTVLQYSTIAGIAPAVGAANAYDGPVASAGEAALRSYRAFVWHEWFSRNLAALATVFAALLGAGSAAGRAATLLQAPPVARMRFMLTRAAVGLGELAVLTLAPSLAIALLSPVIGQHYAVLDALLQATFVLVGAGVFYGAAALLSVRLGGAWRPVLLTLLIALGAALAERWLGSADGPFAVMRAQTYFERGAVPAAGLLASAALTAVLLYASALRFARRGD